MRRRIGLLAIMLVLGACRGGSPVKPATPRASSAGVAVKPAESSAPVVQALLKAPSTAFVKVTGTVAVDAGYLVNEGGAQLQPDGKALIIANNGGGIVANNGGGIVANNGGGIVANNSGNLIANNGGGIISDHGTGLLTNDGASLLAAADAGLLGDAGAALLGDAGAALIANNGGGLIGKVKYRLAAAAAPALGTTLPVGGMVVLALDLTSGKAVPLGQDPAGQPVYAVQSNATGGYELYLPQGLPRNVRLVAVAPGTKDTRLVYSLVTPVQATAASSLDEDTALATRYLRGSMVSYLQNELLLHVSDPTNKPSPVVAAFGPLLAEFQDLAKQKGADKLSPGAARFVAQAVADTVCAYADLSTMVTSNVDTDWKGAPEPAIPAMIEVLKAVNTAAAAKLRSDPKFFEQRPFLVDANNHRAATGLPAYVLEKPADVGELMFHEYVSATSKRQQEKMRFAFVDLGLPLNQYERFRAAYSGTFLGLAQLLVSDETAKKTALATLDAALTRAGATPGAPTPAPSPTPAPAYRTVTTLAGTAEAGYADGPLASARFSNPEGLALDDAGNLYLADTNNHRIRKIGADGQVTTLAGAAPGYADGPADKAQFALPRRLLLDQAHQVLYVSEIDKPRIRKITLGEKPVVSTLAGDGTPGFADGPAASARFNVPLGMALDAAGNLFVADHDNNRVRKVAPDGTVTTVLGSAAAGGFAIGDPLTSVLNAPSDVAFLPDGRLVVAERYYLGVLKPGTSYNVLAGNGWGAPTDGYWVNAQVDFAGSLASDGQGGLYVLEEIGGRVRHAVPAGADAFKLATLVAGGASDEEAFADGPGDKARLAKPLALIASRDGKKIYVSDTRNQRIRLVQE